MVRSSCTVLPSSRVALRWSWASSTARASSWNLTASPTGTPTTRRTRRRRQVGPARAAAMSALLVLHVTYGRCEVVGIALCNTVTSVAGTQGCCGARAPRRASHFAHPLAQKPMRQVSDGTFEGCFAAFSGHMRNCLSSCGGVRLVTVLLPGRLKRGSPVRIKPATVATQAWRTTLPSRSAWSSTCRRRRTWSPSTRRSRTWPRCSWRPLSQRCAQDATLCLSQGLRWVKDIKTACIGLVTAAALGCELLVWQVFILTHKVMLMVSCCHTAVFMLPPAWCKRV